MKATLLCDFGSTFTKLTAVDLEAERILGHSSSFTTIFTDVEEGFQKALEKLKAEVGPFEVEAMHACSSAAGGLRMMVSGLVPELTAEAARLAALGAGAKIIKVFSHEMNDDDLAEIERVKPEIFLLVGGTDGGNSECIIANAELLAECKVKFPIIVAGNRSASRKVRKILEAADKDFVICPNVMPELGRLEITAVQDQIREVFLKEIVRAKGLSKFDGMINNIMMPTPAAAMAALALLADGTEDEKGIGDLMAIDLGGATTDIYSIADGLPKDMGTVLKGLPEPYQKRTVEGDIGMRYSLHGIIEATGLKKIAERAGIPKERVSELAEILMTKTDTLPDTQEMQDLDDALASSAVEVAMRRHCGVIEEAYTPFGKTYVQSGKDLRGVRKLVVTGGALVLSPSTLKIARFAQYNEAEPESLRPQQVDVLIDHRYVLSAMGLLAAEHPDIALRIMKKEFIHD